MNSFSPVGKEVWRGAAALMQAAGAGKVRVDLPPTEGN